MSTNPKITTKVKSRLLSDQENEAIFNIIGRRCLTLCTTLAELSQAEDEKKQTWRTVCSGVVCYVKDCVKRSYFIRFYGGEDKTMAWEHDVFRDRSFMFKTDSLGFLTVTAKDFKLTLTDKEEAEIFKTEIEESLTRVIEKAKARAKDVSTVPSPQSPAFPQDVFTPNTKGPKSKKKKEKLTKESISNPTNFRRVSHFSTDSDTDINLHPEMKALFKRIGLNDQSKIDKKTIDFFYDLIENRGGLKQDLQSRPPPPSKCITNSPPPPPGKFNIPPLPPPNRSQNPLPPPPGKVIAPPPPPPNRNLNPPPTPPGKNYTPPPPPPSRNTNPPPTPPEKIYATPPPPPNRNTTPLPTPRVKVNMPPPPPPNRNLKPLPTPRVKVNMTPPPPPNRTTNPLPPPSGKVNIPPPPPPTTSIPRSSRQTSVSNESREDQSKDDQLKQQLMELLLQNPSEMADLLYNIIDKRGGLQEIKDTLAGRECRPDPVPEHDDELGIDIIDDDDDEWDD